MGLFGRKNKEDLLDADAVLESTPPRTRPPLPAMDPEAVQSSLAPAEALVVATTPEVKPSIPPLPVPSEAPPENKDAVAFGIDSAVALVRQLPPRNVDLVMQVVKKTLESVGVDVAKIIDGASEKEHAIEARITALRSEIESLEAKIGAQKKEIATLEAEQKEISQVKERLSLAQRAEGVGEPGRENTGSTAANNPLVPSNRPQPASAMASRAPTPSVAPGRP